MGCVGDVPDARSNYQCDILKDDIKTPPDYGGVLFCLFFYTINGRFSSVPSATRTFTSIIMNIESGVHNSCA